jgi:hypothetical protein
MKKRIATFALIASSGLGCSGQLDAGEFDDQGALGLEGDGSVGAEAAACFASCSTPAGPVMDFASLDQVYAAMAGQWLFCGGKSAYTIAPADAIGVEYTSVTGDAADAACYNAGTTCGGQMYFLVQGPSGPVRGTGFDYELTYDVSPEGTSYQLNMHPAGGGGIGGGFAYSPCPREFLIDGYGTNPTVIVPVD